ncbi:unnamed protein product [Nesidiocoris tenuis]|uniref:Uncharacterized protein n=1 Tax=Nesidiocoris tenuis TaxID=355587 RepID=A0A6H5HES5_9HEMI|nr:unnamed protein product [Nesidiocoris tenuis]
MPLPNPFPYTWTQTRSLRVPLIRGNGSIVTVLNSKIRPELQKKLLLRITSWTRVCVSVPGH